MQDFFKVWLTTLVRYVLKGFKRLYTGNIRMRIVATGFTDPAVSSYFLACIYFQSAIPRTIAKDQLCQYFTTESVSDSHH